MIGAFGLSRKSRLSEQEEWVKLVQTNFDYNRIPLTENYSDAFQIREDKRRATWLGLTRQFRETRTGYRILNRSSNGLSVDRLKKILERENCRIENVEYSDDHSLVFISYTFLEGNGHSLAVLARYLNDGTYGRCTFTVRLAEDLNLAQVNELNMTSQFLKFWTADRKLILEYPIMTLDIPDNAIAANLELFHGSVVFIVRNKFSYATSSDPAITSAYNPQPSSSSRHADISPSDLNGIESLLRDIRSNLGGSFGSGTLSAVASRLEAIERVLREISQKDAIERLLKEISQKLDKR